MRRGAGSIWGEKLVDGGECDVKKDRRKENSVPSGGVLGLGIEGVLRPEDDKSGSGSGGVLLRRDMKEAYYRCLN